MATQNAPFVPLGEAEPPTHSAPPRPWQRDGGLSSLADAAEAFLERAGHDRGPWLAVAFAAGIAVWFALPDGGAWLRAMGLGGAVGLIGWLHWRGREGRALLRLAGVATRY